MNIQELENVGNVQLEILKDMLTVDEEEYLVAEESQKTFKLLFNPEKAMDVNDFELLLPLFLKKCNREVLYSRVLCNYHFWYILKNFASSMSSIAYSSNLKNVLDTILDDPGNYKSLLGPTCKYIDDTHILDIFAENMTVENISNAYLSDYIACLAQILRALVLLMEFDPSTGAVISVNFVLNFERCNLSYLSILLLEIEELRIQIRTTVLPSIKMLAFSLKHVRINSFPNPFKQRILEDVYKTVDSRTKTIHEFEKDDEYKDLFDLNFLQVFDFINFLEDKNLSFKKTFSEQLLFGDNPFPLSKAVLLISDELNEYIIYMHENLNQNPNNASIIIRKEQIFYALMDRLLKIWVESNSRSDEDLNSLLRLIKIILERVDKHINTDPDVTPGISYKHGVELINSADYKTARNWQLEALMGLHNNQWSNSMEEFKQMLSQQVHDYVRHQRLLQLQTGSWFFHEDPLEISMRSSKISYIILSDNQKNIFIRQFDFMTDDKPYLLDDKLICESIDHKNSIGTMIPRDVTKRILLTDIGSFEKKKLLREGDKYMISFNTKLENTHQKNAYMEITMLDKFKKVLLKLYFDDRESTYIWLDGLKLILSAVKKTKQEDILDILSEDTREQIANLIEVRKNIQMINLNTVPIPEPLVSETSECNETDISKDDEEFYNLDTLKSLTANFYYE